MFLNTLLLNTPLRLPVLTSLPKRQESNLQRRINSQRRTQSQRTKSTTTSTILMTVQLPSALLITTLLRMLPPMLMLILILILILILTLTLTTLTSKSAVKKTIRLLTPMDSRMRLNLTYIVPTSLDKLPSALSAPLQTPNSLSQKLSTQKSTQFWVLRHPLLLLPAS